LRTEDREHSADSFIVLAPDVPEKGGRYPAPFDKERLGFFRDLGRAAGSKSIGVALDRIPPGERMSFTHARLAEEELVYVLEGEVHVRLVEPGKEPREVPLHAGHLVAFVAGTRIAHSFVNRSGRECRLLTVGERKPDVEKCFYAEDKEYDEFFWREHPERYWANE
jgi:uncharacterized cupin superfamily protein